MANPGASGSICYATSSTSEPQSRAPATRQERESLDAYLCCTKKQQSRLFTWLSFGSELPAVAQFSDGANRSTHPVPPDRPCRAAKAPGFAGGSIYLWDAAQRRATTLQPDVDDEAARDEIEQLNHVLVAHAYASVGHRCADARLISRAMDVDKAS